MLDVSNLCVSYGAIHALRSVSFSIQTGTTVAMIGANGAGKSTIMRAISGLVRATSGTICSGDQELHKMSAARIARAGVSHAPEGRLVFSNMTVAENLRMGGFWQAKAAYKRALERALSLFPRLNERQTQLAGLLSGGEQQMLAIARALMADPKLLMLDEPSMGLAPSIVDEIFDVIGRLRQSGMTIFLVEQNVNRALDASDFAYVLELGKVVMQGGPDLLRESTDLTAAYLGTSATEAGRSLKIA